MKGSSWLYQRKTCLFQERVSFTPRRDLSVRAFRSILSCGSLRSVSLFVKPQSRSLEAAGGKNTSRALASRRGTGSCVMAWICARSASKLDMTARAALADAQLSPPPPDPSATIHSSKSRKVFRLCIPGNACLHSFATFCVFFALLDLCF